MKIHLPQAIIRTLTAAAVLVSTPLAVTVATGSFFAGTASAAISVERTGGDFVLSNSNGTFEETSVNKYGDAGWKLGDGGLITFNGNVLEALRNNHGFEVELYVPDPEASVSDTPIVSFGENYPNLSLQVTVEKLKVGKKSVTRRLWANSATGNDYGDITFNSATTSLVVNWSDKLYGTVGSDQFSCSLPESPLMSDISAVTLNSNYVSKFTIKIAQVNTVSYGGSLSKDYGTGTVLGNLGSAAAIVLNEAGSYEVLNGTYQDNVRNADVYIGGGAQLKITSDAGAVSPINVAGDKTIFIDSTGTGTDLVLSSTSDKLAGVNLGNVTLVGSTSTIALSGGTEERNIVLLGSIKEEANETVVGGRTLIITSDKNQPGSGLTLGDSGEKQGSISVGTLELHDTTIYLDGTGSVHAGAVAVTKGDATGVLTNVVMSGSGKEATLSGYGNHKGTVSYANVTAEGTVSNLNIDHSTITLNGTGSVLGGVAASPAVSPLAEGAVPAPSPTEIDNSTINLNAGTSIGKGTKVSNSTINIVAGATGVKVSGDLQNDLIELKNACSLTVEDAVLGAGTRFEAAQEATAAEGSASTVALTNTTVVLGQNDIDLTKTNVLTDPRGVEIFSDKLANVTSVSNITLSFTRDLIEYLENQLGGKGSVHYVKINFTGMKLSGDPQDGWVTGLAGEIPSDGTVDFASTTVSSGNLVTGVVTLGPSVASIPEPTSATLSLLSLAAIAVRRRRKR